MTKAMRTARSPMAYAQTGDRERAIETLQKGVDVSTADGHPSMANEYQMTLDFNYGE